MALILNRFAALNEDPNPVADDDETDDSSAVDRSLGSGSEEESNTLDANTLQDNCHSLYNKALALYGSENYESAAGAFQQVLESKFITKAAFSRCEVSKKLRFNTTKYLGFCHNHRGDHERALPLLLQAFKLDSEDVNLSFKIGVVAARLGGHRLPLARTALEHALGLSPTHWPTLDLLVTITFQLSDLQTCLIYIDRALRRDPSFTKGLQLRKAILKEEPKFIVLCPDGPHIRDDSALPDLRGSCYAPRCILPAASMRDEDDYHTISVGDVTWAEFLALLLHEYRQLQEKRLVPVFVTLCYTRTRPDPVEVSVQNVVQEMVDIVSGPSATHTMVSQMVEDLLDAVLLNSSRFLVSTIIDEIIDDVVATGTAPTARAKNSFVSAFMREVPLDMLEIRRSSRVKMPTDSQMDDQCEEMTAHALLKSFIPVSLTKKSNSEVGRLEKLQHPDEDSKSRRATSPMGQFPSEMRQAEMVSEFIASCPVTCLEEIMYQALFKVCKMSQSPWPNELKKSFLAVYLIWRDSFALPNELDESTTIEYMDVMFLANELLVDEIKEKDPDQVSEFEQFVEDDLLHFRLSFGKLSQINEIRACLMEHRFRLEKKQIDEALYYGKMLLDLLQGQNVVAEEWSITSTDLDWQSLNKTISYLENSKILHKVQEYFDNQQYQKVVEILSETIDVEQGGNVEEDDQWYERLFTLVESLYALNNFEACLDRCALALSKVVATENLTDINNVITTIDYCLQMMESRNGIRISQATGTSLCESLVSILLGQINSTLAIKTTLPWLIFYKIMVYEEAKSPVAEDENDIPNSIHFLVSSHDYAGQLALCTDSGGQLLLALVGALTPLLKGSAKVSSVMLESIKRNLDQAMYCLYCHPSKKSKARYLVDHGVSPLALTWDKCSTMYNVVKPLKMPEFDDFKSSSITADTEALLRRIVALVPDEFNLTERMEKIEKYFYSEATSFPKFPQNEAFPEEMLDVFFLLGDYNFKSSNFAASIPYFRQDLSFNMHRLDSFVQMALAAANGLETRLSQTYSDDIDGILKDSRAVLKIYKDCLKKNDSHPTIFIESANIAFVINAFCSRVIKGEANSLSMEQFTSLEKYKHDCLEFADHCYSEAFRLHSQREDDVDERWLVHFFRGKIKEKQGQDIENSLEEYLNSMTNLRYQGEYIPKKIVFTLVSSDLSQEFLDIYYRFHASILKLELQSGFTASQQLVKNLSKLMQRLTDLDVFDEKSDRIEGTIDTDSQQPPMKKARFTSHDEVTWEDICTECVAALERVKTVYAHHYKALHMLSLYFMGSHAKRSVSRAREYLLGNSAIPSNKQPTLFGERKASNLFNGIWRNPVAELERAGSFPTHVAKCVTVLFEMLRETEDYSIFMEAVAILKKSVDADKKYLFDKDKQAFYTEACSSLLQILNTKAERLVKQAAKDEALKFSLELYQIIRGKKPVSKSCSDLMRTILKMLYCTIFQKSEATFDEVNGFLQKMCLVEKNWASREIQPEDIARILSGGASPMMSMPEAAGNWSQQIVLGGDALSILQHPQPTIKVPDNFSVQQLATSHVATKPQSSWQSSSVVTSRPTSVGVVTQMSSSSAKLSFSGANSPVPGENKSVATTSKLLLSSATGASQSSQAGSSTKFPTTALVAQTNSIPQGGAAGAASSSAHQEKEGKETADANLQLKAFQESLSKSLFSQDKDEKEDDFEVICID